MSFKLQFSPIDNDVVSCITKLVNSDNILSKIPTVADIRSWFNNIINVHVY